jgi:phage anti-repressor protein
MTNNQLVPVFAGTISNQTVQLCNARELHTAMQVQRDFSTWMKSRIEQYGFIDGEDFIVIDSPKRGNQKRGGDVRSIDYHITLDMGKELAMVERNEFGKAARRYFIALERQTKEQAALPAPSTITKEQIGIIYQTLCAKYPNGDNRHAAWSRFNKHFNLNEYKSLPASCFDEALTWIGGVEVKAVTHSTEANEPALHKLPLQTMLTNERYLTYIDSDGTLTARPLASNDFIANMGNLAKRILNDLAFGSSDEDLMSIMDACKHTITQRIEAQERKLGNLKRLIA